jgi:hypothetical protein
MADRINIRHAGRNVEFPELLPTKAAVNVIPVSLAGFHLADFIIPPAEAPAYEITAHLVSLFRDLPPCFGHWTESGRAQSDS